MPAENDKSQLNSYRSKLLNGEQTTELSSKFTRSQYSGEGGGNSPSAPSSRELQNALSYTMKKFAGKSLMQAGAEMINEVADFTEPSEVVTAIKAGKLKKADAILYVEKFGLVTADKIDDLTPSKAYDMLVKDAEALAISTGQAITPGDDYTNKGEKVSHEDQPKPDGSVAVDSQVPSTNKGDQAAEVNKCKPEDGMPKPDGTVTPEKLMEHAPSTQADEVNKSKPQEEMPKVAVVGGGAPEPKLNSGGNQAISGTNAKPEDQPKPDGNAAPKSQFPSKEIGNLAISPSDAKHEDQPTPIKASKEVTADGMMPPMPMPPKDGPIGVPKGPVDHKGPRDLEDKTEDEKGGKVLDLLSEITKLVEEMAPGAKSHEGPAEHKPMGGPGLPPPHEKKDEVPPLPTPPIMASYKADFVEDTKSPEDSYYVASLGDSPLFSISARQAFSGKAKNELPVFKSAAYKNSLVDQLNKQSAKDVFYSVYASKGLVLAQGDKLPTDKFTPTEPPAKDMNASPDVVKDISNDSTKNLECEGLLLELLADVIAHEGGTTPSEVVEQLTGTFSDDASSKKFLGKLESLVEMKKKDKAATDSTLPGPGSTLAGTPPPAGSPPAEDLKPVAAVLKAKFAEVKKLWPEVKNRLIKAEHDRDELQKQIDAYKAKETLKARVAGTLKLAQAKVKVGLIETENVKIEAVRLAQLSDTELLQEESLLENSIKIAKNMKNTNDYIKKDTDTIRTASVGKVLDSVPSQLSEAPSMKFTFSRGQIGRTKQE